MDLVDSIFDVGGDVGREDGTGVHRLGHGLLPCSEQTLHGLASSLVDDQVCVHEGAVEVTSEVNRVGSADVLDNRVEDVESRELPFRACLSCISYLHIDLCRVGHVSDVSELTVRMWFSSSLEIACACSVFSFAMTVKVLISALLFILRFVCR